MEALGRPHRKRSVRTVGASWGAQTRAAKSHVCPFFALATCTMQSCHADLAIAAMIIPEGVHPSLLVNLASTARCMHEPDVMSEIDGDKQVDWQTHTTMMHTRTRHGDRVLQLE
jgi:hypothetical protein